MPRKSFQNRSLRNASRFQGVLRRKYRFPEAGLTVMLFVLLTVLTV